MGGKAVDWGVGGERPYTNGTVGAAGYEGRSAHLELTNQGGVALEDRLACSKVVVSHWGFMCIVGRKGLPIMRIPYSNASIQAARRNPLPIKGDSVDLAEMALQSPQTLPRRYTPYFGSGIVASGHDQVAMDL